MARARDIIEGIESFGIQAHVDSPVVPLALNNGFVQYVQSKVPNVGPYLLLMRYMRENHIYVGGRVTRRDHHYVHERTTTFKLEVADIPDNVLAEVEAAANEAEKMIAEEIVDINHKIYKALEREWDWLNSDENVDETITANRYEFDEIGNREDGGGYQFAQLDNHAKEVARNWYREGGLDYNWWDITDEWKTEIEEMGFQNVDIAFSGFYSQGDGASFTGNHFDLNKWTEWFFSNKPTERGHPYSDDLFLKEALPVDDPDDPDDPEMVIRREVAFRSVPINSIRVLGKRWFRRGPGTTYHSAYIWINNKLVHVIPFAYGYGHQYLYNAFEWLKNHGFVDMGENEAPWQVAQRMGFHLDYEVEDVPRKADL